METEKAMTMDSVEKTITERVSRFYKAHPYPKYPLFAKPIWQEGYLSSSLFSQSLLKYRSHVSGDIRTENKVLIAGSGEILPYVVQKNEPKRSQIYCVDVSSSSLRRAKFRTIFSHKNIHFVHDDLDHFLSQCIIEKKYFDHIDAYGVLHHLANPSRTLELMTKVLAPSGTIRLMVYNTEARRWIRHIQRAVLLMKLSPYKKRDLKLFRQIVNTLTSCSTRLSEKLSSIGTVTLENDARLVDTFFHVRETRLPLDYWCDVFKQNSLKPIALFDRYGELDDLKNPLWQAPSLSDLEERVADGRFENNFEWILSKDNSVTFSSFKPSMTKQQKTKAPRRWLSYNETKKIDDKLISLIWNEFLSDVAQDYSTPTTDLNGEDKKVLQRLARIGAITPWMAKRNNFFDDLMEPMEISMEPPAASVVNEAEMNKLQDSVKEILEKKRNYSLKRLDQVMRRFKEASL